MNDDDVQKTVCYFTVTSKEKGEVGSEVPMSNLQSMVCPAVTVEPVLIETGP